MRLGCWVALALLLGGCASVPSETTPAGVEEAPRWVERNVANFLGPTDSGGVFVVSAGSRNTRVAVGDRVVWRGFGPVGKVTDVYEFRCKVYVPLRGGVLPEAMKRVRVWFDGVEPDPWGEN